MSDTNEILELEACSDCIMLLANAETDPNWTEEEENAYLAQVESVWPDDVWHLVAGNCGDNEEEHIDFTWSRCDVCERPSNAGGRCKAAAWRHE